jgi:hypothetical protein
MEGEMIPYWALCANIAAVEVAKGWPARWDPPRQGILYGAWLGQFVVISETDRGSTLRLYALEYDPAVEGALNEAGGPLMYDMDRKQEEGPGGAPGDEPMGGGLSPDDLTSLEEHYGEK